MSYDDLSLPVSDAELDDYREAVNPMRHVRCITDFLSPVLDRRVHKIEPMHGDPLPWEKGHGITFRMGEVTLWVGINGHGKSAVTTQVAAFLALRGRRSCIASYEMLPVMTIDRMLCQVAGGPSPTEEFTYDFFAAMRGRIWIYDRRDQANREMLYRVIRYCAAEKKINHFWIDSLMRCVKGEDDYNGQKDFVGELCSLAKECDIHIHLVHHSRKSHDENTPPNKFDAKGSGAISDQVDQFISVWRNKKLEAELAAGKGDSEMPGFVLIVDKNRNGGWEGRIPLWGDLESWHFRGKSAVPWTKGYDIPKRKLERVA